MPRKPGVLNWLTRRFGFREYIDSICLTRSGLNQAVVRIAQERMRLGELVFLIAQFPETFLQVQQLLDQSDVNFRIQTDRLSADKLNALAAESADSGGLVLTLGGMIAELEIPPESAERRPKVSVMVVERHPLGSHDQAIVSAARTFPFPTSAGFFVALDDPLLAPMAGDWVGDLLRQMGASDHELISSQMVSRRVRSAQRRLKRYEATASVADSAKIWFQENTP